jgi:hypothetical protein
MTLTLNANESIINTNMENVVDTSKEYTIGDIRKYGVFPWAKHYKTIVKLVRKDMERENILQARITGENQNTRYFIKGKNIIKYIKRYGNVLK